MTRSVAFHRTIDQVRIVQHVGIIQARNAREDTHRFDRDHLAVYVCSRTPRCFAEVNWVDRDNVALLTDLYELTMLHAYWREGMNDEAGSPPR